MPRKPRIEHETLELGPLPVQVINRTLDRELREGDAILTGIIQRHVLRSHPDDYSRCLLHVAAVVLNPLFIGEDFKNPGKIELIARVPAIKGPMLVAVEVETMVDGKYEVRSFYPISETKIENRLAKGFLKRAQKR